MVRQAYLNRLASMRDRPGRRSRLRVRLAGRRAEPDRPPAPRRLVPQAGDGCQQRRGERHRLRPAELPGVPAADLRAFGRGLRPADSADMIVVPGGVRVGGHSSTGRSTLRLPLRFSHCLPSQDVAPGGAVGPRHGRAVFAGIRPAGGYCPALGRRPAWEPLPAGAGCPRPEGAGPVVRGCRRSAGWEMAMAAAPTRRPDRPGAGPG